MDGRTLWEVLNEVPDRRGRKGRQYALRSVLGISLAAMLAGANDLRAIFRWGRRLAPDGLRAFGIEGGRAPCHATYHYFFAALDGEALSRTLGRHALGEGPAGHVALDGKSLCGSIREGVVNDVGREVRALHVLSAFATDLSAVIGDLVVAPESSEIAAALSLLKDLPLDGAVITGDAIFAQRQICQLIRDRGGQYLFTVKGNQAGLMRDIKTAFGDDSPLSRSAAGSA